MFIIKVSGREIAEQFDHFEDASKKFDAMCKGALYEKDDIGVFDVGPVFKNLVLLRKLKEVPPYTVWATEDEPIGDFNSYDECVNAVQKEFEMDDSTERFYVVKNVKGNITKIFIIEDNCIKEMNRYVVCKDTGNDIEPVRFYNASYIDIMNNTMKRFMSENDNKSKYFIIDRFSPSVGLDKLFYIYDDNRLYAYDKSKEKSVIIYTNGIKDEEVKDKEPDIPIKVFEYAVLIVGFGRHVERDVAFANNIIKSNITKFQYDNAVPDNICSIVIKEFFRDSKTTYVKNSTWMHIDNSNILEGGFNKYYKVAECVFDLSNGKRCQINKE